MSFLLGNNNLLTLLHTTTTNHFNCNFWFWIHSRPHSGVPWLCAQEINPDMLQDAGLLRARQEPYLLCHPNHFNLTQFQEESDIQTSSNTLKNLTLKANSFLEGESKKKKSPLAFPSNLSQRAE